MIDIALLQKQVFDNKVKKGFNTTDIPREFCNIYEEVAEAYHAYAKKEETLGEELADVCIFVMGLAEMLKLNLEEEIVKKIEKNKNREYKMVNGVLVKSSDA